MTAEQPVPAQPGASTGAGESKQDLVGDGTAEQPAFVPPAKQGNGFTRGRKAFKAWRGRRPFWAGVFVMLSAGPILWAPYNSLNTGQMTVSIQSGSGTAALIIGFALIGLGLSLWIQPAFRVFAGVGAMILGLIAVIAATFGGFFVGTLLAVIGGALAASWAYKPGAEPEPVERDHFGDGGAGETGLGDLFDRQHEESMPQETVPEDDRLGEPQTGAAPRRTEGEGSGGLLMKRTVRNASSGRALTAFGLAVAGVVGAVGLASASETQPDIPLPKPSYAEGPCVSASPSTSSSKAPAKSETPTPTPTPSASTETKSTAPSTEPSTAPSTETKSAEPSTTPTTATSKPAESKPAESKSASPSASPSKSEKATGKPRFPCPVQSAPANQPGEGGIFVNAEPFVLKSSLLAMAGMDYKGVVKVKTLAGEEKSVMKFEVSGGLDIWNLSMIVKDPFGKPVEISSDPGSKSWMKAGANYKTTMYTESLKGNLLGIIPITFTPDFQPPNVPVAFFTNVEAKLWAQTGGELHIPGYGINKKLLEQ